jgi:ribonuclease T1
VVFRNAEHILPLCSAGYHHEHTVPTCGSATRGARRIITGSAGEYFYTGGHYASFSLVNINKWARAGVRSQRSGAGHAPISRHDTA